ncbi:PIN domain nuclease [Microlunatus speluncae]|uniref:PIN domain nuclease n=1 Tax=Microlunatus speluncae TaxID=2594267 RepID=UPI001FE77218|nr:PIN domain nuclease [Microlunatus speluncae]
MTTWLIDKSALVRLAQGQVADRAEWDQRIQRGLVHISTITRLELGYSVRTGKDGRAAFARPPVSLMPVEYCTPRAEDRAHEVQLLLADAGRHRAPSVPDLLLAAIAETAGLSILAVDKDFGLIAEITGQPVQQLTVSDLSR